MTFEPIDLPESNGFYWAWAPSHSAFVLMSVYERDGNGLWAAAFAQGIGPCVFNSVLHLKLHGGVVWYGPSVPMPEPVHLTKPHDESQRPA